MNRIVPDLPADAYHATKALSASGAWVLASECPAMYHARSPFNPDRLPEERSGIMDVGTALHLAALEPARLESLIATIDALDWRTNAAKAAREDCIANGLVPLLRKDRELVDRLSAAMRANRDAASLLEGAETEVSYFWDQGGVPCKARADIVAYGGAALADIKSSASASPSFFARRAYDAGHFLRAVFYAEGWRVLNDAPWPPDYWFVIVSRDPPHLVTVARLDAEALEWGRAMMGRALDLFRECRERGAWPPYCAQPATLSLPSWATRQFQEASL